MNLHRWNAAVCGRVCALALLLTALPLTAQGTIRDGNTVYRVGAIGASQTDAVDCDFTADPAVSDILAEQWWYYRLESDNDIDERPLRDDGTLTQRYQGTHAHLNWADVDRRGLIRVELGIDVVATGPNSGVVYHGITVFNISGRSLNLNLFHYADIDVCGAGGARAFGTQWEHKVNGPCTGQSVAVSAYDPSIYLVEDRDDSECNILDPGPTVLPDRGLPFASGNYTSAVQWQDVALPPGVQFTVWTAIDHNPGPRPPARSQNYGYGLAGSVGMPQITTLAMPVMGSQGVIKVSNAPANVPSVLVFGFGRTETPIGPLTLFVLAGPRGTRFDSFTVATDATGCFQLGIPIPNDREYSAKRLTWQCFLLDPGLTGAFPMVHTDAIEWVLGR